MGARAVALAVAFSASAALARPSPGAGDDSVRGAVTRLATGIVRVKLPNGLRIVLHPEATSPTVAICLTYDVGSRNERPGQSGLAHLVARMMSQGSRNVQPGEHSALIRARGGSIQSTTSEEHTSYCASLPASEIELALWLEADRMQSLRLTPQNFESQRAIALKEQRTRLSQTEYAQSELRLAELVFQGYSPYEHPGSGALVDVEQARFEWIRDFFRAYYVPNNAVLSIVGSFDVNRALELSRKYFGEMQPSITLPAYAPPLLPRQSSERFSVLEDGAQARRVYYGWMIPPSRTAQHYALEIAAMILDGQSSHLYQELVRERGLAREVVASTARHRGPDLFSVHVALTPNARFEEVERAVGSSINRLARAGPTEMELERAKKRLAVRFVLGLESNGGRASRLAAFEALWGDARLLTAELQRFAAVRRDDVKRAVREHLVTHRRTTVEVLPRGGLGAHADARSKAKTRPKRSAPPKRRAPTKRKKRRRAAHN